VSVADLIVAEDAPVAYVLFIEGTGLAFTNEIALAGSGASSWIGTTYGEWVVLHGLEDPPDRRVALDWQTGMLDVDSVTFRFLDQDGVLASLFVAEPDEDDIERIGEHLDPTEDPAPATKLLYGGDGAETVDIRDRHVGIEYIDASGNRRQFWIAPDHVNLAAMKAAPFDHPVVDHEANYAPDALLPGIFASEAAFVWAGRKVALYAIHYDRHTGTWPEWRLQVEGGTMDWYGTLRDQARMTGPRQWEIQCDGPHSWRQKLLNTHRPSKGFTQVRHLFSLDTGADNTVREDAIHVQMFVKHLYDESIYDYGTRDFLDADDFANTDTTAPLLRTKINSVIQAAIDGNTNWAEQFGVEDAGAASFTADGFQIKWKDGSGDDHYGYIEIVLHEKVWTKLGFDLKVQTALDPTEPAWLRLMSQEITDQFPNLPGSGYRRVRFYATPVYGSDAEISQNEQPTDNNGALRYYKLPYGSSAEIVELDPKSNQLLAIADGGNANPVYMEGQLALPPSQGYDATAFMAFVGQIQRADESEPRDYAQVAKVSYDLTNNRMDTDSEERVLVRVDKWLDPRAYGFPHDRFEEPWLQVRGGITAYPLAVIGGYYSNAELDDAHLVLGRLHSSSGTPSAWTSHDQDVNASITPGENDTTGTTGEDFAGGDLEIQDLGLNLPPVFVDFESFREAADHLPGGAFGDGMAKCKVAMVGPLQAREVIEQVQRPLGMATSWKPYQVGSFSKAIAFGAFSKFATLSQEQVEVVITEDDLFGNPDNPLTWFPGQQLRFAQPVDQWTLRQSRALLADDWALENQFQSLDRGVRHRRGDVHYQIDAPFMRPAVDGASFTQARARLQRNAARWYAGRHFPITITISPAKASTVGVGTVVRVTMRDVVDSTGAYGITNRLGRVIEKVSHHGQHATIRILIQADNPNNTKHWAPMGRVYGWDESSGTYTIHLAGPSAHSVFWALGDAFEKDDGKSDALGFDEPDWSTTGGTAQVRILQSFNGGRTWGNAVTGTVTGADTTAHTVDINSVSGTLYRDTDKLMFLRAYADQDSASWTRNVYSVVTKSNGKHGSTKGSPLK